jgi:hypothetical protein
MVNAKVKTIIFAKIGNIAFPRDFREASSIDSLPAMRICPDALSVGWWVNEGAPCVAQATSNF